MTKYEIKTYYSRQQEPGRAERETHFTDACSVPAIASQIIYKFFFEKKENETRRERREPRIELKAKK